ncbi:zonular occludens toxin domain-containing protein [Nitrosomonas sp.]|uniref:zonular occludens toxin domain-containing protein n=1 Tax=Nitrosomonas sp. TaxID=42353 RepID=UPI0033069131
MSITLITAVPGGGKTIYAVWHIIKKAVEEGRIIYTAGIPELKLPVISLSYSQIKQWPEREMIEVENPSGIAIPDDERPTRLKNITEGSLIVIDEVQYLWPASGSKEPTEDIRYLTKHRHHGLEIVLITQSPQLVHKNVLAVVDKHLHIRKTWAGRQLFEWPEYCATVRAVSSRISAIKKGYKLPKQAYGLYRSASTHIKQKMTVPIIVYLFPLILIGTGFFFYRSYSSVMAKTQSFSEVVKEEKSISQHEHQPTTATTATTVATVARPVTLALVSNEVDWSKVGACVSTEKKCICYGKTAEKLVIPPETCRKAVTSGWPGQETKV